MVSGSHASVLLETTCRSVSGWNSVEYYTVLNVQHTDNSTVHGYNHSPLKELNIQEKTRVINLKVPYGLQSICKQTCKHLVRCTLHILMYMLIFSQSNSKHYKWK